MTPRALIVSGLLLACGGDTTLRSTHEEREQAPANAVDAGQPRLDASSSSPAPTFPRDASDPSNSCVSVRSDASRLPVHLAFAFDVSGSMGKGDEPWHDKQLKWDPVVAATRAFFEAQPGADQAAPDLSASLTFFPADDDKCDADSYAKPDVPFTALPSDAFGAAIAEIEPESEDDWRGGTPTLFALRGTRAFVESYRPTHPGSYAIVLVSDGYPQGCDDDDDRIETVVAEAKGALAAGLPTYVIGVANPKLEDAPDTVSNLGQIAEAGGTERAFLIDTGDPAATSAAFASAVEAIRARAVSCELSIPKAPDGRPFDRRKVVVRSVTAGARRELSYDPSCTMADAWRYDDEATPTRIALCGDACKALESVSGARIEVDFACEDVLFL